LRTVRVRLGKRSYETRIGHDLLGWAGKWLRQVMPSAEKAALITNPEIDRLYGAMVKQGLEKEGFKIATLLVPEGEEHKTLDTAAKLYAGLQAVHADQRVALLRDQAVRQPGQHQHAKQQHALIDETGQASPQSRRFELRRRVARLHQRLLALAAAVGAAAGWLCGPVCGSSVLPFTTPWVAAIFGWPAWACAGGSAVLEISVVLAPGLAWTTVGAMDFGTGCPDGTLPRLDFWF